MDNDTKEIIKIMSTVIGIIIAIALTIGGSLNLVASYYQSQITGYSWAQCFWSGDTVHNIVLKK